MNRKSSFSRRDFLQTGLIGSAGAALLGPSILGGIGFAAETSGQLLRGAVQPLELHRHRLAIGHRILRPLGDRRHGAVSTAHVKTCINLDARAYEFMAEKFPEVAAKLKKYLAAGNVELIAGTYGQPMGTTIGGESNIRQMVVGRETVRKALDYDLVTFLEEEEFTPSADSAVGRVGRLPLRQPGPVGHLGPGRLPRARPQFVPLERDGRDARSRACRRTRCSAPGRREATGRLARVQEARGAGQAAVVHLGGVRLGQPRAAGIPYRAGQVQGAVRPGRRRIRHDSAST